MSSMEGMWLRAWIDGLHSINNRPAVRPVEHLTGRVVVPVPDAPPEQRTAPR